METADDDGFQNTSLVDNILFGIFDPILKINLTFVRTFALTHETGATNLCKWFIKPCLCKVLN